MEAKNIKNALNEEGKFAVIRVRGETGIKSGIKVTLNMLSLYRKNFCIVVPKNKDYSGMVMKAKDYITWGEINNETLKELIKKRGEEYSGRESDKKGKIRYNKFIEFDGKKMKKYFRLNSPKKGFGRKGIKEVFSKGGALGYRAEKINEIIMRML